LKLARRLATINGDATPQATVRLMSLLGSPGVANSDVLTVSVISDIEKVIKEDLPMLPPPPPPPPAAEMATPVFAPTSATIAALPLNVRDFLARRPDLLGARTGLGAVAASNAAGMTTAAREDTPLKLAENEVMTIAQDYSDPRLGEGLRRAAAAIGNSWPSAKDVMWLGESGRAPALDLAFRSVAEEKLADFVNLLKIAVSDQDAKELDELLAKMA
jgi:hypothetical protein